LAPALPLRDLVRVKLALCRQFHDPPPAADRLKRTPGLELGRKPSSVSSCWIVPLIWRSTLRPRFKIRDDLTNTTS
jgi:hypothetical protein